MKLGNKELLSETRHQWKAKLLPRGGSQSEPKGTSMFINNLAEILFNLSFKKSKVDKHRSSLSLPKGIPRSDQADSLQSLLGRERQTNFIVGFLPSAVNVHRKSDLQNRIFSL